jgi:hypothetical protein
MDGVRWWAVVVAGLALPAAGQTVLYGIDAGALLYRIDKATGAGTVIGPIGFGAGNGAAADSQGRIFTHSGASDLLILVDPGTGAGSVFLTLTGRPVGYGIRGMAFDPQDHLYVALSRADTTEIDLLATIDMTTGVYSTVGPTGRTDIQGLAFSPQDVLYAAGVFGGLYRIDPATAAATVIGGSFVGDDQALEFDRDGTLYCARINLRTVDPNTGLSTLIGPIGMVDIRGLAMVGPPACYANCDQSTQTPVLNVNDFVCFQSRFAAADPYADCDHSMTLNVNDFVCFQAAFAAGCG